jgi:plasmid stability protein
MEEEVREILGNAVAQDDNEVIRLGSHISGRFAGLGLSTDLPEI